MTVAVALGAGVASALPGPRLEDPTPLESLDAKAWIPDVRVSTEASSASPFDGLLDQEEIRMSLLDQDSPSVPSPQSVSPTSTTTSTTTTSTTTTTRAPDQSITVSVPTVSVSVPTVSVSIPSPQSND